MVSAAFKPIAAQHKEGPLPVHTSQAHWVHPALLRHMCTDGPQQKLAASLMNTVCGQKGCQAVLGMRENLYP
jgi:hypothetical protein